MSLRNDIIRLAYNDPKHREELLGLVLASEKEAEEKEAKFEKGKKVDVGDWLKANGHADAAAAWEKHEGEIGKKAARDLADIAKSLGKKLKAKYVPGQMMWKLPSGHMFMLTRVGRGGSEKMTVDVWKGSKKVKGGIPVASEDAALKVLKEF